MTTSDVKTTDPTDDPAGAGGDAAATSGLSTAPREDDSVKGLGALGWARWTWRQLTSMRTALILLFLLALGSIPGSIFPQRSVNAIEVTQYIRDSPTWGPILDRLDMFDVFGAPWFSAIYVLLFVSLIGCVIPRSMQHARVLRQPPPKAPRHLSRLPQSRTATAPPEADPQEVLDLAATTLRKRRWRLRAAAFDGTTGWVAAEKGYSREVGNLLFHISLMGILAAIALGSMAGFSGRVIVKEGTGFADAIPSYDSFTPGRLTDSSDLPPFAFTLDKFTAAYQRGGTQNGAPREFSATVTSRTTPDAAPVTTTMQVNEPLVLDGVKIFLVGHGYAPKFTIKDKTGAIVFQDSVVFLPQDGNFTSTGVVKAFDTKPELALQGFFLPTAAVDPQRGPYSSFPAPDNPAVFLSAWTGTIDASGQQTVYKLDTSAMKQVGIKSLIPGETWTIPTTGQIVTFDGFVQFATFSVARDPGTGLALAAALLAILGLTLSLLVQRRRVWVRATRDKAGATVVEVAGLTRSEHASVEDELDALVAALPVVSQPAHGSPPGE
ncbi:MAG TPA: cytochrome c biogenesis protein ResB [Candidatus Nanopelagicales bacterium]|jgi:cytochrome c biogenesis protein